MNRLLTAPAALAALLFSTTALAQDQPPPPDPLSQGPDDPAVPTAFDGDYLTVGVGATYGPGYEGSNSYVVSQIVGVMGRLGGITITPRPSGLAADFINDKQDAKVSFALGPVARFRFDRNKQIRDPVVYALGTRDVAFEVGGTAGVSVNRLTNPYDTLSFSVDVRWDVAGAYKGNVIQPTVTYATPLSTGIAAALTLHAEHVDDKYAHYYFDVTPAGSAASGLPVYTARGGWKSAHATLVGFFDLDGDLTNGGFAVVTGFSYARMLGNIADSPVIAIRGDKDQFTFGGGLAYTF